MNEQTDESDVPALERLLYEHRENGLTCYDHPSAREQGAWCCTCGAHDLTVSWRRHMAEQVAVARATPPRPA